MRALVIGGSGFVGTRLIERLHLDGWDTLNVDIVHGDDIRDTEIARAAFATNPDVVFYLAAHHYIPWCDENPNETLATNVLAFTQMLRFAYVRTVVLASSAAVYGFGSEPFSELDPPDPVDIYGRSKWLAEEVLHQWSREHPDTSCVSSRLFNVVGPGDPWPHALPVIAEKVANQEPVIVGNTWPRRDYVHVDDVAAALALMHEAGTGFTTYNVCTGRGTSIADVLSLFGEYAGEFPHGTDPDRRRATDGHLVGRHDKITRELGWEPTRTVDDAVRELLEAH